MKGSGEFEASAGPQAVVLIALLLVVAGILCLQVVGVSVLRFLGHVQRGTDLTAAAVAIAAGGAVLLALAVDGRDESLPGTPGPPLAP